MKKALATFAFLSLTAAAVLAQDMVVYSFTDGTGAATINSPNITAGNFTAGQPGVTSSTGQFAITTTSASNNSGASGTFNAGISATPGSLNISTSSFFEFTLTPTTGFHLDVTSFQLGSRSTGTGPITLSLRSNLDGFGSDLASFTVTNTSAWAQSGPVALSFIGPDDQAVTFRVYGSGGSNTSSAINWRVDDVKMNVAAIPNVPEPATVALLVSGLGLLVGVQRFRRKS